MCVNDFCTSVTPPQTFADSLSAEMVTSGETFAWHVNPSTRPIVAGRTGREPVAPPQANITMVNDPNVVPDENVYFPFAPTPARVDPPYETFQFVVHGPQAADNGSLTVHIDWADAANDWDLYVYKDDVPAVTGTTETWSFTCRTPSGATASSDVLVQRGESVDLGVACPS